MSSGAERGVRDMLEKVAVLVMLLIAWAGAWHIQSAPSWRVDVSALEAFPERMGIWRSAEMPLEPAVESALGADLNIQRIYRTVTGDFVWLYIGYYGTDAGGRPAHTPRGCYPGAGWGIKDARVVDVPGRSALRVNEYLVERDGEVRLVHFWYRSHRRSELLGGIDQNIDRLMGRLSDGRADGALIRVSAPVSNPKYSAAANDVRGRLLAFVGEVDLRLGDYWPTETPDSRSRE